MFARLVDDSNPNSAMNRFRNRRFAQFRARLDALRGPVSILDIGGTMQYWRRRGVLPNRNLRIVLLNLRAVETTDGFESIGGDAADLSRFRDGEFDVAFSNSVIEHLFTAERQKAMAREVSRVARNHWIQTPNYWFPLEPHFLFPGWQWLPRALRIAVIRRTKVGQLGPGRTPEAAAAIVDEVRLLSTADLQAMFPTSRILPERCMGFVKSITAVGGPNFLRDDARSALPHSGSAQPA